MSTRQRGLYRPWCPSLLEPEPRTAYLAHKGKIMKKQHMNSSLNAVGILAVSILGS